MKAIQISISNDVLKRLKSALIVANISGRGLSLNEKFMDKLLQYIKEGKTQGSFKFKLKNER